MYMQHKIMDIRVFFLVIGASLLTDKGAAGEHATCEEYCPQLVQRFQLKGVHNVEEVKSELNVICNEETEFSETICQTFLQDQAAKVAELAGNVPASKICSEICPLTLALDFQLEAPLLEDPGEEELNKTEYSQTAVPLKNEIQLCTWCKQRVQSCYTIASSLRLSFDRLADTLCPLLRQDLRSVVMCRSIISEMATNMKDSTMVENNVCSAIDYCDQDDTGSTCPFQMLPRASSKFETVFNLVSMITRRLQPQTESEMLLLRSTYLVLDETAKCFLPFKKESSPKRSSRHAKMSCKMLCKNVNELISAEVQKVVRLLHFYRKQFKGFCSDIDDNQLKKRCYTIRDAANAKAIIRTLFRKHICNNLDCQFLNIHQHYRCQLCKHSVKQQKMKNIVRYGVEALSTIKQGIEMLCTLKKDDRCDNFLRAQEKVIQVLTAMMNENEVCSHMGFCSKS